MRRRRLVRVLAATGTAAAMTLPAAPAFAADHDSGREGAVVEEFVCFLSTGDRIRLGTGVVVTTPSGETRVVCTGQPL